LHFFFSPDDGCGNGLFLLISLLGHCRLRLFSQMKAKVIVMPKPSILDPQGVAVRDAVGHHGLVGVKAVRVGKVIELETDGQLDQAALHEVCRDLLSNPVIEDYHVVVE